jgi:hypothetical protein
MSIEGKITGAGWNILKANLQLLAGYTEGKITGAGWIFWRQSYGCWLDTEGKVMTVGWLS